MTFGKRQLMIGALVAALGTAVYLNWQFSGVQPVSVSGAEESSSVSKQLGQTTYVNTELSGEDAYFSDSSLSSDDIIDDDEESVAEKSEPEVKETAAVTDDKLDKLSSEQREFFLSEKEKRDDLYEETMEDLKDILEAADRSENAKTEAVKAADALAKNVKAQNDIETEIKAKGFSECIAAINNSCCTVILPKNELNDASVVTVKDIVSRHAGVEFENITITPVN